MLAYIPLPNVPGQTAQNFLLQSTTPHNTDGFNIHVLHTINAKFNVNLGYNFNSSRQDTLDAFLDIRGRTTSRSQSVDLGLTHNWSPKLIENTHLNWSRSRTQTLSANSFVNNIAGNLGISGIADDPMDYGLPGINFSSFTGFSDPVPSRVRNQTLRASDAITWIRTKHTLTFGGEVRRIELNSDSNPDPRGLFRFTGVMTTATQCHRRPGDASHAAHRSPITSSRISCSACPTAPSVQFGDPNTYFRSWGFIAYAQDDFRVNKRFTLSVRRALPVPDAADRALQSHRQSRPEFHRHSRGGRHVR